MFHYETNFFGHEQPELLPEAKLGPQFITYVPLILLGR